jgi:hypothetical protein
MKCKFSLPYEPISAMSFFVSDNGLGVCTDVVDLGTYDSQHLDKKTYPGHELIVHTCGTTPWKMEIFERIAGWIRLISEAACWAGKTTSGRVFFVNKRAIGTVWIPDVVSNGQQWLVPNYADPQYDADHICVPDPHPPANLPGAPFQGSISFEHWPSYLEDHRTSPIPATKADVDVVRFSLRMGANVETYSYGRWIDTLDGKLHGLGLVNFEAGHDDGAGFIVDQAFYADKLVKCSPIVSCFRSPD